jgi:hypothetical protein
MRVVLLGGAAGIAAHLRVVAHRGDPGSVIDLQAAEDTVSGVAGKASCTLNSIGMIHSYSWCSSKPYRTDTPCPLRARSGGQTGALTVTRRQPIMPAELGKRSSRHYYPQPSKLVMRVRFPSPAPPRNPRSELVGHLIGRRRSHHRPQSGHIYCASGRFSARGVPVLTRAGGAAWCAGIHRRPYGYCARYRPAPGLHPGDPAVLPGEEPAARILCR